MASASFAPAAFAVNHDETFPRILEMVTSASPAELEGIKEVSVKANWRLR